MRNVQKIISIFVVASFNMAFIVTKLFSRMHTGVLLLTALYKWYFSLVKLFDVTDDIKLL